VRIGKIYKSLSQSDSEDKGGQKKKRRQTDSKVGRQLSELATKAVIIMCFMLLILLPMFNGDFWISEDAGTEGVCVGIKSVLDYKWSATPNYKTLLYSEVDANRTTDTSFESTLAAFTKSYIENFANVSNGPLLKIKLPGASVSYYETANFSQYRLEEVNVGMLEITGKGRIEVHQDGAKQSTADSYISIVRTFFICFILLGGSNLFSVSTYNLIINPIERMTEKVIDVIEKPQKVKEKPQPAGRRRRRDGQSIDGNGHRRRCDQKDRHPARCRPGRGRVQPHQQLPDHPQRREGRVRRADEKRAGDGRDLRLLRHPKLH
jgi:hypothetical protein